MIHQDESNFTKSANKTLKDNSLEKPDGTISYVKFPEMGKDLARNF